MIIIPTTLSINCVIIAACITLYDSGDTAVTLFIQAVTAVEQQTQVAQSVGLLKVSVCSAVRIVFTENVALSSSWNLRKSLK